jgi:repressor LexA
VNEHASPRQLQVLRLIAKGLRAGRVPTIREIGEKLKIRSTNGVNDHLEALEKKGLLERGEHGKSRSITVTEIGWRQLGEFIRRCDYCGSEVAQ